uniref:Septum formation initiator family protein n=1 Tax=Thermodesulfobacterium geofontis TaxID=1295609 RepID=A0A7V5N0A3_9BACT
MVLGETMLNKRKTPIVIKPYKKKRKKRKKWFLGILIIGFIFTLSIYLILSFMVKREMKKIEEIKKENRYYRKEIQKLSNSDMPYEELLRTRYGYIRKGEKIIIYSPHYYNKNETKEGVGE